MLHDETFLPEGISKSQSSRWQTIARFPEDLFEREIPKANSLLTLGLEYVMMGASRDSRRFAVNKPILVRREPLLGLTGDCS